MSVVPRQLILLVLTCCLFSPTNEQDYQDKYDGSLALGENLLVSRYSSASINSPRRYNSSHCVTSPGLDHLTWNPQTQQICAFFNPKGDPAAVRGVFFELTQSMSWGPPITTTFQFALDSCRDTAQNLSKIPFCIEFPLQGAPPPGPNNFIELAYTGLPACSDKVMETNGFFLSENNKKSDVNVAMTNTFVEYNDDQSKHDIAQSLDYSEINRVFERVTHTQSRHMPAWMPAALIVLATVGICIIVLKVLALVWLLIIIKRRNSPTYTSVGQRNFGYHSDVLLEPKKDAQTSFRQEASCSLHNLIIEP